MKMNLMQKEMKEKVEKAQSVTCNFLQIALKNESRRWDISCNSLDMTPRTSAKPQTHEQCPGDGCQEAMKRYATIEPQLVTTCHNMS